MPRYGARELTEEEVALLAYVAARKIAGPLGHSPERDRLRRVGFLEGTAKDMRQGQDTTWVVTKEGAAFLAKHRQAA